MLSRSRPLLNALLLALAVSATSFAPRDAPTKLSISRQFKTIGVHNVLEQDRARALQLASRKHPNNQHTTTVDEPVTDMGIAYVASIGIGKPPTEYTVFVDTGSSNTWIGAHKTYVKTITSKVTRNAVSVSYGSGAFSGTEYIDTVTLGSLAIPGQSIGVSHESVGFKGYDGILGIGPFNLTFGTLYPDHRTTIPTVTDNAFSQRKISANEIGISFEPAQGNSPQNGEITWGGVDYTKFTGSINYAPVTSAYPARLYWGVDQSITYGYVPILLRTAGIVDTGTTFTLIATDAFNVYQSVTGAVMDIATGLLTITPSQYRALKNLDFHINGKTYSLTPNAQIWPRSLNRVIRGNPDSIYLVVADLGSYSGGGLDFVNGYTFLERFYSVYDTANERIGFATTPFTTATSN